MQDKEYAKQIDLGTGESIGQRLDQHQIPVVCWEQLFSCFIPNDGSDMIFFYLINTMYLIF